MAIPDGIVVLILIAQNDDYCTVRYALLQSLFLMLDLIFSVDSMFSAFLRSPF